MPVLQAAQVGKTVLAALVDDGILVDPACARRIGADRRMYVLRQPPADLLQVFNDPRARPVEVRAILKDYIDVGIPEHGLRANGFDMRGGQQAGDDRIGHLVFDDVGRLTRPDSYGRSPARPRCLAVRPAAHAATTRFRQG